MQMAGGQGEWKWYCAWTPGEIQLDKMQRRNSKTFLTPKRRTNRNQHPQSPCPHSTSIQEGTAKVRCPVQILRVNTSRLRPSSGSLGLEKHLELRSPFPTPQECDLRPCETNIRFKWLAQHQSRNVIDGSLVTPKSAEDFAKTMTCEHYWQTHVQF